MKRTWILGLAAAVALALVAWGLYAARAGAQQAPDAGAGAQKPPQAAPPGVPVVCGQMNLLPSPNAGSGANDLYGVSALTSNDVWAVGDYYNGTANQALVERWDGSAWSVVTIPSGRSTTRRGDRSPRSST